MNCWPESSAGADPAARFAVVLFSVSTDSSGCRVARRGRRQPRLDTPVARRYFRPRGIRFTRRGNRVDDKDQVAWEAYRQSLERPEELFVGWQNQKGTQFSLCPA